MEEESLSEFDQTLTVRGTEPLRALRWLLPAYRSAAGDLLRYRL
jgi:hypothetical protein